MNETTGSGLFITFEGGDGTGKSTHANRIVEHLHALGHEVLHTHEPGGTDVGQQIRNIVLHHDGDIDPRAEALLFAADRAHHIATVVRPALQAGKIVIQDRYIDSSVAYQGSGRDLGADEVRELSLWGTRGLLPDLVVLLDLDPEIAQQRMRSVRDGLDRLEREASDYHRRVREQFLQQAGADAERYTVVDANRPHEQVANEIRARIDELLAAREQR